MSKTSNFRNVVFSSYLEHLMIIVKEPSDYELHSVFSVEADIKHVTAVQKKVMFQKVNMHAHRLHCN
jgi:hypothetical protein